jgi:hypothetical protein
MERLMMRARPDTIIVFKLDITPHSPSEDQACPWIWECYALPYERTEMCRSGSATTWRQAMDRAAIHADGSHGVSW